MSRRNKSTHSTSQVPAKEKIIEPRKETNDKQINSGDSLSFTKISQLLPVFVFVDILRHATDEISKNLDHIETIKSQINSGIQVKDAQKIIECIDLLIDFKESMLKIVSWSSIIASIVYSELENESTPEEAYILDFKRVLIFVNDTMDILLSVVPQEPILGITLAPDQKQFSETKAIISKAICRLEEIQKENKEAESDWGIVEENAYQRMLEGSNQSVPAEDFLGWLSDLKEGKDV